MRIFVAAALVGGAVVVQPLQAQSLEALVRAAPPGAVRMSYAAREDVCGNGSGIHSLGSRNGNDWLGDCDNGPVRVQLEKDEARIVRLDTYVGGAWRPRDDVTDLGEVPADEASEFLLDLAATASPSVAEDAVMPAAIADAPDPWQRLLTLARDRSLNEDVREQALFWVGQSAADDATEGLTKIVTGDETTDVQKAAVFALSRRDDPERIDRLMRVARTHANPDVVRSTFFWLAQSEDERVFDLFEEILTD